MNDAHAKLRRVMACLCAGLFIVLLAAVLQGQTSWFDDPIRYAFYDLRADALTPVLIVLTHLANKYTIICLCLLLLILPQTRLSFGVPLSAGSLGTIILNSAIKHLVCRARPDILHLVEESGFSFPSGHSISSLFFYGMAIWLVWHHVQRQAGPGFSYDKRTAWILTVLLLIPAIMIGLTRIYLGVHFPTDILAGWCLGGFAICVEAEIILALERRHQNSTLPGSLSK